MTHTYTLRETYGQVRAYPTSEELIKALPLISKGQTTLTQDVPEEVDPIYPYGHRS